MPTDMEELITDAVDDSVESDSTPEVEENTQADETAQTTTNLTDDSEDDSETTSDTDTSDDETPADEFATKFGLKSQSVTGRENRIPYSRVKKIVTKAEKDATERITKELEAKWGTEKYQPLEAKVKDYEGRLEQVAQFEQVMERDPKQFLGMLATLPAYKEFFDYIGQLVQGSGGDAAPAQPAQDPSMPQPDQELQDGSRVYSLDGLQKLLNWQSQQVEDRVTRQVEQRVGQRYAPIEQEWQANRHIQSLLPHVDKQITEARQWPNFNELEADIVKALKADKNITLERAYMQAYQTSILPKLTTDRNKLRTEILNEIKTRPTSTTAPIRAVKSDSGTDEPRNLEDIIRESVKTLKR